MIPLLRTMSRCFRRAAASRVFRIAAVAGMTGNGRRLESSGAYSASAIAASVLIAFALLANACLTTTNPDVPEAERRASALNKAIMCPVCPGESIDQSQNALAAQMRAIVDEKLAEGWSEQQIKDFFVERYGPSVLLEPPSAGFGIAAWIVPPFAFALAIASLLLTLRWMRRSSERRDDVEVEDSERMRYMRRLDDATRNEPESAGESQRDRGERV